MNKLVVHSTWTITRLLAAAEALYHKRLIQAAVYDDFVVDTDHLDDDDQISQELFQDILADLGFSAILADGGVVVFGIDDELMDEAHLEQMLETLAKFSTGHLILARSGNHPLQMFFIDSGGRLDVALCDQLEFDHGRGCHKLGDH